MDLQWLREGDPRRPEPYLAQGGQQAAGLTTALRRSRKERAMNGCRLCTVLARVDGMEASRPQQGMRGAGCVGYGLQPVCVPPRYARDQGHRPGMRDLRHPVGASQHDGVFRGQVRSMAAIRFAAMPSATVKPSARSTGMGASA